MQWSKKDLPVLCENTVAFPEVVTGCQHLCRESVHGTGEVNGLLDIPLPSKAPMIGALECDHL